MSNAMYESIVRKIDSVQEELGALALALHEHPELSFQEHFCLPDPLRHPGEARVPGKEERGRDGDRLHRRDAG